MRRRRQRFVYLKQFGSVRRGNVLQSQEYLIQLDFVHCLEMWQESDHAGDEYCEIEVDLIGKIGLKFDE